MALEVFNLIDFAKLVRSSSIGGSQKGMVLVAGVLLADLA